MLGCLNGMPSGSKLSASLLELDQLLLLTAAIFACKLGGMRLARPPAGVEAPVAVPVAVRRSVLVEGVLVPEGGFGLDDAVAALGSACAFGKEAKVGTAGAEAIPRSPFCCIIVERLCPVLVGTGLVGGGDAATSRHFIAATAEAALLISTGGGGASCAPGMLRWFVLPSEACGLLTVATGEPDAAELPFASLTPFSREAPARPEVSGSTNTSVCRPCAPSLPLAAGVDAAAEVSPAA